MTGGRSYLVTALFVAALALSGQAALAASNAAAEPNAEDVAPSRFGEQPADEAFGAFQRGLYLTARNLALPRAEKGDAAAQTLLAEIYARGLGVPRDDAEAAKWRPNKACRRHNCNMR